MVLERQSTRVEETITIGKGEDVADEFEDLHLK